MNIRITAGTAATAISDQVQEVGTRQVEHRERGECQDRGGAEVGLQQHEHHDRDRDHEERQRAGQQAVDGGAALGEPVREVHDKRELHDLRGVNRRQRSDLDPAGGAADHDVDRLQEHEEQAGDADEEQRQGGDPEPAVVDPHHHHHGDEPQGGPLDLRTHDRESVVPLGQVGLDRGRRVDHQDPDRRQGDGRDEDPVLGLMALALESVRPRPVLGRGADGRERHGAHAGPPSLDWPAARAAASRPTDSMKARPRAA